MGPAARLLVFSVAAAICAVWTILAGKDVNWDLLNYHYYLPYELVADRIEQDFFAASAQSYLNPIGYLPFYLMVASGWHSVVASIVLAAAHSLSLGLLFLIAWKLFAHLPGRDRAVFATLATAMGAATAVYWATVGSSFLDPLLVPPMLGALVLLLDQGRFPACRAALAGALLGAAAALKYSNAIFALAAFPLVLAMPGLRRAGRLHAGLAYAGGGAAALALLAGPWLMLMYREFGNPVFPLMNAWFQSPYAPPLNMFSVRFSPTDWGAALSFPFRMVALDRSLYSEMFAPDIRLALLVVAGLVVPALAARRGVPTANALGAADWRVFVFLVLAAVLWLKTSANGRYGMIVLLLAGVCLVRVGERVLPAGIARVALLVVLLVQIGTSILASPARWFIAEPWSRRWLPYEVPERALREPALYLTLETLSMSVVAPFVHPGSSFVNFRGQTSLATDSPRLVTLLERHRGRVRALGRALNPVDGRPPANDVRAYDDTLTRIGYRVDADDCFTIEWRPVGGDAISRVANWLARAQPTTEPLSVTSCGLRAATRDPARAERERQVSALFDRIEKSCPEFFRGHTAVTEPLGSGWSRHYVGLDARLEAIGGNVILNRYRAGDHLDLGRLSDWEGDGPEAGARCGERAAATGERRE